MIDHVGFPIADYEKSKAFYAKALAPLGYVLVMEVPGDANGSGFPAAGFGENGKPDFWIGGGGGVFKPPHVAVPPQKPASGDSFLRAGIQAGGEKTTVCLGSGRTITRIITAPSYSIPMDTTSRRCVTRLHEMNCQDDAGTKKSRVTLGDARLRNHSTGLNES